MMRRSPAALAALVAFTASAAPGARATQAPAARASQAISASATAILVDVVVRDGRGRPVTDLAADDFRIAEDGVSQTIDSFTRISRGGIGVGVAWKAAAETIAVVPPDGRRVDESAEAAASADSTTAIVFDHLSPETLRLAQEATLEYVPRSGESPVRIGIFATDPGIRVLQSYTTDRARVRDAVTRISPAGTSTDEEKRERTADLLARRRDLQSESSAATAAAAAGGAQLAASAAVFGQQESELRLIQTEINMIRSFEALDRGHQGYDTWRSLQAVVRSLAEYPGRKTLVFFSEGLPVSPVLSARLDAVIDAANRANVTAYAIDANGLRAKSTLVNTRREVDGFAEERFAQLSTGSDRTDQPLTMAFERVEDTLTLDSRAGLARLARDTGGFLVEGDNDLSSAFRRIDEDTRFHYLLTYSPTNTDLDGSFRRIAVQVRRPGTQVFARKGYRAVRAPAAASSAGFEQPALALLDRTPLPNTFPVFAAGFSFPDPIRPGLTPIVVRVGTDALRFTTDEQRGTYTAQAAVVVRLRDGSGRDIQTLSQQYVFSGGIRDLAAARLGEILFYREADLGPGIYTMETMVFDAVAAAGSARVATLTVPGPAGAGLGMSSLVLVNRVEQVDDAPTGESARTAPLYVGQSLLYPNLGEPIRRTGGTELPFYFELFGDTTGATVTADLLSNGRPVASAPLPLAAPAGPRLQQVGRLPVGTLPAGTYELRITVARHGATVARTAYFTLRD